MPHSPLSDLKRPLADLLRPLEWDEFQGLDQLDQRLVKQLGSGDGRPPSLILWGPPGSGKTTLARMIGRSFKGTFVESSGVLAGVKDIRDVAEEARARPELTMLFVDEIHRLNRAQQDAFLPHVEAGTFTLIGATTENPSFYLNGALLSRTRVVPLKPLTAEALTRIAERAAKQLEVKISAEAAQLLARESSGDARRLLNYLEAFVSSQGRNPVEYEALLSYLRESGVALYDRQGEEHYNIASAFIKSMRGSDADAALYWAFRMIDGGEDPRFVFRRMIIFASEDIGNADPRALPLAVAAAEAYDRVGLPEGRIPLSQCITFLATAPKSNRSYVAMGSALQAVKRHPAAGVPSHLRNAPTKLLEQLGYGEGYHYPHDTSDGFSPGVRYLPSELQSQHFYEPSEHGYEKNIKERLEFWRKAGQKD